MRSAEGCTEGERFGSVYHRQAYILQRRDAESPGPPERRDVGAGVVKRRRRPPRLRALNSRRMRALSRYHR
jgi:hypothetical protein